MVIWLLSGLLAVWLAGLLVGFLGCLLSGWLSGLVCDLVAFWFGLARFLVWSGWLSGLVDLIFWRKSNQEMRNA